MSRVMINIDTSNVDGALTGLLSLVAELLSVDSGDIDPDLALVDLGFEPVSLMALLRQLQEQGQEQMQYSDLAVDNLRHLAQQLCVETLDKGQGTSDTSEEFTAGAGGVSVRGSAGTAPGKSLSGKSLPGKSLPGKSLPDTSASAEGSLQGPELAARVLQAVKQLYSEATKIPLADLDADESLEAYGIDSILISKLNQRLDAIFGDLSKTLFYEYQTLAELAGYFVEQHAVACQQWLGGQQVVNCTGGVTQAKSEPPATKPVPAAVSSDAATSLTTSATKSVTSPVSTAAFPQLTSMRGRRGFASSKGDPVASASEQPQQASPPPVVPGVRVEPVAGQSAGCYSPPYQQPPIAIIGVSGRYPKAPNLQAYWSNLAAGVDAIDEIPSDRWSIDGFFQADRQLAAKEGKSYSKWGGFLSDVFLFDPLFFKLTPREAVNMDPQERVFLQTCWHVFEDAGYTRQRIACQHQGRVGVFAGITKTGFDLHAPILWQQGQAVFPHTSFSSLANRVSYFFNLNGPSVPVDTMCSSSLTAIHQACQQLQLGVCDMAIAGGVNIYTHPSNYVALCSQNMLSSDGRCKSFGLGGNGFVPGEGVGCVLLKPLALAQRDGDPIHALIRSSHVNHDGKTNGYTVPNPLAQAQLIRQALDLAAVDARYVSYIEAHGTGTELGDPIEITGLKKAFAADTGDRQYCALGSAKSNIGHLEAAAGIAGLTKILLQLKHQQLVPSLHAQQINSNIDLSASPFVLQQSLQPWQRPLLEIDGERREVSRIAGISSFGAGGANAHLVVEEYIADVCDGDVSGDAIDSGYINSGINSGIVSQPVSDPLAVIPLSAQTAEALQQQVLQLRDYLQSTDVERLTLRDLAYTLQTGREAMAYRLVFTAASVAEIKVILTQLQLQDDWSELTSVDGLYIGDGKSARDTLALFNDADMQAVLAGWLDKHKFDQLLPLWVKGLNIDWSPLYRDMIDRDHRIDSDHTRRPRMVSLPGYPFAREAYCLPATSTATRAFASATEELSATPSAIEQREPVYLLQERWATATECGLDGVTAELGPAVRNIVICLSDRAAQSVCRAFFAQQQVNTFFIAQGNAEPAADSISIDNSRDDSWRRALSAAQTSLGTIDAVVYLAPLENADLCRDYMAVVQLIQALPETGLHLLLCGGWQADSLDRCYFESWLGFERSVAAALPKVRCSSLFVETTTDVDACAGESDRVWHPWVQRIWTQCQLAKPQSVLYRDNRPHYWLIEGEMSAQHTLPESTVAPTVQAGATYLISGGCGGLGLLVAENFASQAPVNLILTGRRALTADKREQLQRIEANGSQIHYLCADIADEQAMRDGLNEALQRFGSVDGLVHVAGVEGKVSVVDKTAADFDAVVRAKVLGSQILHQVLQDQPLQFVVYFSSTSAIVGDFGFCDYAIGNRFLMAYGDYLNHHNPAVPVTVINWPMWADGGMGLEDKASLQAFLQFSGQRMLSADEGLACMHRLIAEPNQRQQMVLPIAPNKLGRYLSQSNVPMLASLVGSDAGTAVEAQVGTKDQSTHVATDAVPALEAWSLVFFQRLVAEVIQLPTERLDVEQLLDNYGVDSIVIASISAELEKSFEAVPKTLLFECQTVSEIQHYFMQHKAAELETLYRQSHSASASAASGDNAETYSVVETTSTSAVEAAVEPIVKPINEPAGELTVEPIGGPTAKNAPADDDAIAIIGVAGRYPQADTVEQFWQNLCEGKDCISKVPAERWQHDQYLSENKGEMGTTYCEWGGFIDAVDQFDALLFNISPREAEVIDPNERQFLQTVWELLERNGLTRDAIRQQYANRVGVFAGTMFQLYHSVASDPVHEAAVSASSISAIANRVSYYFDFQGPSIAIDTMCSSSLSAIHLACDSLRSGACQLAIAGAVNLTLHPNKYLALSLSQVIGSHANSRSFADGDGYLPSEGVGAVLLKPLAQAQADGDPIWALIRASAVNHGGISNGYSVPNPARQSQLLIDNFQQSGIHPDSISYVESAANGSPLADLIEVTALQRAFSQLGAGQQKCAIGSVKSNIGHAEAASGMSQLTKVIFQMRHQQLVPTLMPGRLNPEIDFSQTPFRLQTELSPWQRPHINLGEGLVEVPLRASISSIGAGGSNAHLIVEEYRESTLVASADDVVEDTQGDAAQVIVLSARTSDRLPIMARRLYRALSQQSDDDRQTLANIAHTLQVGRESLACRLAWIVTDRQALLVALQQFSEKNSADNESAEIHAAMPTYCHEVVNADAGILFCAYGETDATPVLQQASEDVNKLEPEALRTRANTVLKWTAGDKVDWPTRASQAKLLLLPTYPFAQRRCWLPPKADEPVVNPARVSLSMDPVAVDPVVDNRTDPSVQSKLQRILCQSLALEADEMRETVSLSQYGVDSIALMQILQQIQAQLQPYVELSQLKQCDTMADMARLIRQLNKRYGSPSLLAKSPQNADPASPQLGPQLWPQFPELIRLNAASRGRPVFWIHGGLGGVEVYDGIADVAARPFFGIQARGWMTDREPLHGIEAMASYYVHIIMSVQPQGPYDLGGYSLGGILAYEITRQLQELDQTVNSLVMLDSLDYSEINEQLNDVVVSPQTSQLQAVNMALLGTVLREPDKIYSTLIHRDELDGELDAEAFLSQLIQLSQQRGLRKSAVQIERQIQQNSKTASAYGAGHFVSRPLRHPEQVQAHYFKNASGVFFGGLQPYFTIDDNVSVFDDINYWQGWQSLLPNLEIIEVNSSNHLMMLSEPEVYERLNNFCQRLYQDGNSTQQSNEILSVAVP